MEWYIPITILPGVGMFTLSTSRLLISLNTGIINLNSNKGLYKEIIDKKISQLKTLNYALIFQYISAFCFVIGGVLGELFDNEMWIIYFVLSGVIFLTFSIILLIIYALKSLKIREKHLTL